MPQIITANRLQLGGVVYWDGKGWTPDMGAAEVLPNDTAEAVLKKAQEFIAKREVVGVYLFDVRETNGTITPVKMREAIRAAGPTIRTDLGKQAGN